MADVTANSTAASTSVATLVGLPVVNTAGEPFGRVVELAVNVAEDGTRVSALLLQNRVGGQEQTSILAVHDLNLRTGKAAVLHTGSAPTPAPELDSFLLLKRDLLDQQIIDVDGRKVVRVNDVNLAWEDRCTEDGAGQPATALGQPALRITEVEVGMRGATRRLLKGLPVGTIEAIATHFHPRSIPWSCVDLIERDPARRVRLKIGQDRLSKLHPSDIADILEDLAPAEREAVFTSLPEETAAETLEEIEPKMQIALLQGLDSERAADIVEEMDPGAAADLLAEMSDEQSEAILEEMEPEERHDVEELLEFSANSAAGRMTTDFVSVPLGQRVADAVEALRTFEGDADTITEVYLTDEAEKLKGVVTLPRLLMAGPDALLQPLAEQHIVCCTLNAPEREVAELFDKYNLRSLPVVNYHGSVAGVIHAEQVIAQLREG